MNEQSEKMKRITVSIGGISYQLVSKENENYTREIAQKADETIRRVIQQHPSLSTMQAIILSMVNTIDALTKVSESLEESQGVMETIEARSAKEMENLKHKMTKAQHELFLLRDTDFELKKEVLRINELNKQLELEIAALRKQAMKSVSEPFAGTSNIDLDPEMETDSDIEFDPGIELDSDNKLDSGIEAEPDIEVFSDNRSDMAIEQDQESELVHEVIAFSEEGKEAGFPQEEPIDRNESDEISPSDELYHSVADPFPELRQPSLEDLFSE